MDVNVKKLDSMPGMPGGFAFAMVLLGIALAVVGPIFTTIDARFFEYTGRGLGALGHHLIEWGAILQAVLWVCSAFRRTPPAPPAA